MTASLDDVFWYQKLSTEEKERIQRLVSVALPYDLSYSTKDKVLEFLYKL